MLDDTMKLAILEKMGEQLQDIADTLEATQPSSMSKVTYHNTLRDVRAQLEAIKWAHSNCVAIEECDCTGVKWKVPTFQ